ncbi:MAG: hypothetical protein M5U34_28015 [Chloroflexi bacterium]|nr:hypothetical protein [Chloroflexota bacterium]
MIVLADSAERSDEIDLERARQARERAETMMREGVPEDPDRYAQIRASLERAQIRINVAQRRRRSTVMPTGFRDEREDEN